MCSKNQLKTHGIIILAQLVNQPMMAKHMLIQKQTLGQILRYN